MDDIRFSHAVLAVDAEAFLFLAGKGSGGAQVNGGVASGKLQRGHAVQSSLLQADVARSHGDAQDLDERAFGSQDQRGGVVTRGIAVHDDLMDLCHNDHSFHSAI